MRSSAAALVLWLALGVAAPAMAAVDLAVVAIGVETLRENGALFRLTARLAVEGDQIFRAELTPPGGTKVALTLDGDIFVLEQTFTSEQALASALPDGEYRLTLNGTIEVTFDYERTPVASPAITAPLPGSTLVPGPVTVEFSRCLACTEDFDTTEGRLIDVANDVLIANELLDPKATSWPDEDAPPIELPEEGSFVAAILHTALRGEELVPTNGDAFALVTSVIHADAVRFFTGAATPAGSFCIAVADELGLLDPLGECLAIDEPSAALIDPSGEFALSAGGVDMAYDADVSASGAISGKAHADLDGNGSLETTTPLRGKLQGFMGKVDRSVSFDFRSMAPAAKLAVRIHEQASVEDGALDGSQRAKGTVAGAKIKEDAPSTLPLGDEPLGWRLDVELAGKHVEDASVTLEDGRSYALRGRFHFDFLTSLGKLDLRSEGDDEGVWVRVEDFGIDDIESQPPVFGSGDFTFKILGQRGRIDPLP